jgi:hypothetical protein
MPELVEIIMIVIAPISIHVISFAFDVLDLNVYLLFETFWIKNEFMLYKKLVAKKNKENNLIVF